MNSQDIRNRFKKPDLDKEKERQDAELAANNIQRLTLVNEKLPQLKLSQAGTRYIRLLPQTEESEDTFSHMLAFVYVDSKKIPNHSGYMALTQKQSDFLRTARAIFLGDDRFRDLMYSRERNPSGIELMPRYKELFLGFLQKDPEKQLYVIILPSNGYNPKPTQLQAGTKIKQFPFEKSMSGKLVYGDIFDIEHGRLIKLETSGDGDKTTYTPSVDEEYPLTDPEFDEVLSKVVPFSEIITYASQKLFLMYLRSSLTDAMFQHLMRETGAEDKLRGKTITEDEWQSILSVPPNRIGYTKYTANRAAQYRPTPAKVAPKFEQKTHAAMEDAYNDGEDPNDDLDYGTAKAPSAKEPAAEPKPAQETAAKVSKTEPAAAQDEEEITEEQRTTRKCIEAMRATGCKDSAIPPQLFIQAGWKVPQGNLEAPAQ